MLTYTKEDLVMLATAGPSIGVRRSAAEALYLMGQRDGIGELRQARDEDRASETACAGVTS